MEIGKKGIYVVQSLIVSYIITGIILCVLALIMYQLKSGTKIAEAGVTATYILASMAAGWTAGRRIGKRKFLWGLASGILYFLILLCISAVIHPGEALISGERVTVFLLCAAGGMLGGIFG